MVKLILNRIEDEMRAQKVTRYKLAKLTGLPKSTVKYVFDEGWGKQIAILQKMCEQLGLQVNLEPKE